MKQKIVFIVAILVGMAAFVLTHRYLRAERDKIYGRAQKVEVIVAKRDLPAGTVLTFDDLAQKQVFKTAVGENVFKPKDLDRIVDKKLRYGLKRAEPVWWSYVDLPSRLQGGIAPMVKSGMRAVSIGVSSDASVSNLINPNDRVDILGTFVTTSKDKAGEMETVTMTVLQDVTVMATGQRLARDDFESEIQGQKKSGYNMITFEVTPREAELLVFAQHVRGELYLTLRNPEDVSFEKDLPEVDFQHIEMKLPELNLYRQRNIRHKSDL